MEELITTAHGPRQNQKKWGTFKNQNDLVVTQLSSMLQYATTNTTTNTTTTMMDTTTILANYHINILRPDQHKHNHDCLHSCLPGTVDVYNHLLLHWLVQSRTIEDVNALQDFNFLWK